jgi:hypothetical protein
LKFYCKFRDQFNYESFPGISELMLVSGAFLVGLDVDCTKMGLPFMATKILRSQANWYIKTRSNKLRTKKKIAIKSSGQTSFLSFEKWAFRLNKIQKEFLIQIFHDLSFEFLNFMLYITWMCFHISRESRAQ